MITPKQLNPRWYWYNGNSDKHVYPMGTKIRTLGNTSWEVGIGSCSCCAKLDVGRIYHIEKCPWWLGRGGYLISEYNVPNKRYFNVVLADVKYEKMPEFWNWKVA
jgi:hypothetical protein